MKKIILEKAKEGNILIAVPSDSSAISFAESLIPMVLKVIEDHKLPMIATHGSKPFVVLFGESEKLLGNRSYLAEFEKSSKNCTLIAVNFPN